MRFIKENPSLAAGIGLPILLLVFFSLASIIPQWTVAPPKYDLLFSIEENRCDDKKPSVNFKLVGSSMKAEYLYPEKKDNYSNCYQYKKLYRFSAAKNESREIVYDVPAKDKQITDWKNFEIAEVKNLKLDGSKKAKDGYEFFGRYDRYYGGGLFFFGGGYSSRNMVSINNSGRAVNISPFNKDSEYYYSNVEFIGWVEEEGAK